MPPAMPIVSVPTSTCVPSVSASVAPTAAMIPARMAPRPVAVSQPKKAEPQAMPPNSSRWRSRTAAIVLSIDARASSHVVTVQTAVAVVVVEPRRHVDPVPVGDPVMNAGLGVGGGGAAGA